VSSSLFGRPWKPPTCERCAARPDLAPISARSRLDLACRSTHHRTVLCGCGRRRRVPISARAARPVKVDPPCDSCGGGGEAWSRPRRRRSAPSPSSSLSLPLPLPPSPSCPGPSPKPPSNPRDSRTYRVARSTSMPLLGGTAPAGRVRERSGKIPVPVAALAPATRLRTGSRRRGVSACRGCRRSRRRSRRSGAEAEALCPARRRTSRAALPLRRSKRPPLARARRSPKRASATPAPSRRPRTGSLASASAGRPTPRRRRSG